MCCVLTGSWMQLWDLEEVLDGNQAVQDNLAVEAESDDDGDDDMDVDVKPNKPPKGIISSSMTLLKLY